MQGTFRQTKSSRLDKNSRRLFKHSRRDLLYRCGRQNLQADRFHGQRSRSRANYFNNQINEHVSPRPQYTISFLWYELNPKQLFMLKIEVAESHYKPVIIWNDGIPSILLSTSTLLQRHFNINFNATSMRCLNRCLTTLKCTEQNNLSGNDVEVLGTVSCLFIFLTRYPIGSLFPWLAVLRIVYEFWLICGVHVGLSPIQLYSGRIWYPIALRQGVCFLLHGFIMFREACRNWIWRRILL